MLRQNKLTLLHDLDPEGQCLILFLIIDFRCKKSSPYKHCFTRCNNTSRPNDHLLDNLIHYNYQYLLP